MKNDSLIACGTVVLLTEGEYAGYSVCCLLKTLQDADILLLKEEYSRLFPRILFDDFIEWLIEKKYFARLDFIEWHLGSWNNLNFCLDGKILDK